MKKVILAISLTAASTFAAFGQAVAVDDYKKAEGFVGYSNGQVDTGLDSGSTVNDFSGTVQISTVSMSRAFTISAAISA